MLVDLCCGPKKREGAVGVDIAPYPGVDVVCDLNQTPWPLEDNMATSILCEHGIEHVQDVVAFMKECHRVLKSGGELEIVTPHFSSANSYGDPTHLRHLSAFWFRPFTAEGYLSSPHCQFELEETKVTFGKSLSAKVGYWIERWRGLEKWEKNSAFRYPGMDIQTRLKCLKP